jgi:hypothetical protein
MAAFERLSSDHGSCNFDVCSWTRCYSVFLGLRKKRISSATNIMTHASVTKRIMIVPVLARLPPLVAVALALPVDDPVVVEPEYVLLVYEPLP